MSTNPYEEEKISDANIGFNCKTDHIVLDISWSKTPNWATHPVFSFLYAEAIMKTIGSKTIQIRIPQKIFIEGTLGYLIQDLLAYEKMIAKGEDHGVFNEDYAFFKMSLQNGNQKDFEQRKEEEKRIIDESIAERLVKITPIEDHILVTFNPKIDCLLSYFLDTAFLQQNYQTHFNDGTNTYRFTREEFQEIIYKFNVPILIDDNDLVISIERLETAWRLLFCEFAKKVLDNCLKYQLLQNKKDKNGLNLRKKLKGEINSIITQVYSELTKIYQRDVWSKDETTRQRTESDEEQDSTLGEDD
ncbi:MAG: hypothetical protein ACTSO7_13745 [Candidatus Heimdallarchaeota archaeon]